jgi:hypothetical protein
MKHLSRKYKKRTLRKTRVFRKKSKKTFVKKRNYKKRNTRKRRRVGGMDTDDDDIEVGRINEVIVKPKPRVPFININDPSIMESGILKPSTPIFKSTTPTLKPPTPSVEPTISSWQGFPRTSKENLKKYMKKGDFSRPPLTDSQENRELLMAFAPEVFEKSDDEFQTPRSSVSSGNYGTPRSEEETDPILDLYTFKDQEERNRIAKFLKSNDSSSSDEDDYYSEENRLKRLEERRRNMSQTMKDMGYEK